MNDFFAGPLFFSIAITMLTLGVILLSMLFRQAWILFSFGFFGIALAIPGWLTVVGTFAGVICIVAFVRWTKQGVGRTL